MKITVQLIFILVLGFILELFLPWWSIAIAAFAGGMIFNSRANFLVGFLAIALLWTIKALLIEASAAATLTEKVASIFMLNKPLLFLVMAVIGGLVGGFAATTGSALQGNKRKNYY
jgi:ABC-type multidrug transport system fused ATPase/permease subunit